MKIKTTEIIIEQFEDTYRDEYPKLMKKKWVAVEDIRKILSRPLVTDNSEESLKKCQIIKEYRDKVKKELEC